MQDRSKLKLNAKTFEKQDFSLSKNLQKITYFNIRNAEKEENYFLLEDHFQNTKIHVLTTYK